MEYSVYDLVRIVLKKWYIVLLITVLLAGASTVTSQLSYEKAVSDYESLTTETVPVIVETGTTTYICKYGYTIHSYAVEAVNAYQEQNRAVNGDSVPCLDMETAATTIFAKLNPQISQSIGSGETLQKVQDAATALNLQEPPTINGDKVVTPSVGALVVANHLQVVHLGGDSFQIVISGLEKTIADQIVAAYNTCVSQSISNPIIAAITEIQESSFTPDPLQPTTLAIFAQTVMKEPPAPPNIVKTAGTAAVLGFALGCFLVLLVTFIKDTRPAKVTGK